MVEHEKSRMIPRITFDTNVCNVIHEPGKRPHDVDPADARAIRSALSAGHIQGYVSGAALFVECLSFGDKLRYLAAAAGTTAERPSPEEGVIRLYQDLADLGIHCLHAPLLGSEDFVGNVPMAPDEIWDQAERQKRFSDFIGP